MIEYLLLGKHSETFTDVGMELYEAMVDTDILTREDIEFNLTETLKEGGDGELEKEALATDHDYFEYVEMGAYLNVRTDKALELLTHVIMVLAYRIEKIDNEPKKETYRFTVSYDVACEKTIDMRICSKVSFK